MSSYKSNKVLSPVAATKPPTAFAQRFLLGLANVAFTGCGVTLLLAGFYLFTDTQRILLSRLLCASNEQLNEFPQPLFYYVALALAGGGAVAIVAAMVGWWAVCLNTVCMLTMYFLVVLLLLLVEFSICLAIVIWPHCLGVGMDESAMVKALQGGYGVPGRDQFTAAVDLAQTRFECCAINSDINYDTSLWRLQAHGQSDWTVPLTCCRLQNGIVTGGYLDPQPVNMTGCQSLERHENAAHRHSEGCFEKLDIWYRQQYMWFLGATLVVAVVEFVVILCIIWNCMRLSSVADVRPLLDASSNIRKGSKSSTSEQRRKSSAAVYNVQMRPSTLSADNIYTDTISHGSHLNTLDVRHGGGKTATKHRHHRSQTEQQDCSFDDPPPPPDDDDVKRKVFVQPPELYQSRHSTHFRPHTYELSRSYLV